MRGTERGWGWRERERERECALALPFMFFQENALLIANTLFQQHKRRLYTWTSPDGQHRNQIDYILWHLIVLLGSRWLPGLLKRS